MEEDVAYSHGNSTGLLVPAAAGSNSPRKSAAPGRGNTRVRGTQTGPATAPRPAGLGGRRTARRSSCRRDSPRRRGSSDAAPARRRRAKAQAVHAAGSPEHGRQHGVERQWHGPAPASRPKRSRRGSFSQEERTASTARRTSAGASMIAMAGGSRRAAARPHRPPTPKQRRRHARPPPRHRHRDKGA